MKTLFRILIFATAIGMFLYYTNSDDTNTPLEGPKIAQPAIPTEDVYMNDYKDVFANPQQGISQLIGQSEAEIVAKYGEPSRKDVAAHESEWWIYEQGHFMISIENGTVNEVYTNSPLIDVSPYKIGQQTEDVYRMTMLDGEITVKLGDNIYIFAMNEQDMKRRLLVQFETIYAQIYLDEELGEVAGIRFLDGKSLVLHQPYEMQYMGDLIEKKTLSSSEQLALNETSAMQLFGLVNNVREHYELPRLERLEQLDELAAQQSESQFLQQSAREIEPLENLDERLKWKNVTYQRAAENIALAYYDPIEAVHGLLNSKEHRKELLQEAYTHIGTGVYYDYYTQIFIEQLDVESGT